ncbi:MAG: hypothetical protein ACM3MI_01715 [Clostridiales bacterium]
MESLKEHIKKFWHFEIPLLIWLSHLLIILFILPSEALKDERVFYYTALLFKNIPATLNLNFLSVYDSPQTPISFYFAGIVLNIHQSITALRISNSVVVMLTVYIFCSSVKYLLKNDIKTSIFLVLVFLINPYLHLISILFYTDSLYLLCVVILVYGFIREKESFMFYFAMFLAPLVRQFGVIFASGNALGEIKRKSPYVNKNFIYSLLSLAGLCFFLVLWQGTMPNNSFRESMNHIREVYGFIYPYIPAYHLSALGFYMSPLLFYYLKKVYRERSFAIGAIFGGIFYSLFPARQNYSTIIVQPYNKTLGFYHKIMLMVFHDPYYHIVLILFAMLAGGWIAYILRSAKVPRNFKIWSILFFIMSFGNLQAWDKYLLDIEAVLLISFIYLLPLFRKVHLETRASQ